jgi:hypothetical protein
LNATSQNLHWLIPIPNNGMWDNNIDKEFFIKILNIIARNNKISNPMWKVSITSPIIFGGLGNKQNLGKEKGAQIKFPKY